MKWTKSTPLLFIPLFVLTLVACSQKGDSLQPYGNITVETFTSLSQQPNTVILDVRTPNEYNTDHVPTAINIDYYASNFKSDITALDTSKTYLVYCAAGTRSSAAVKIFENLNFPKVYNLKGGFRNWSKQNTK